MTAPSLPRLVTLLLLALLAATDAASGTHRRLGFARPRRTPTPAFAAGRGFGAAPAPPSGGDETYERFRCECPADVASVKMYEPSLGDDDDRSGERIDATNNDGVIWAATYRASRTYPTVLRDDFVAAMQIATSPSSVDELSTPGVAAPVPVAVARLRPSGADDGNYVIDSLRCKLKKETTNAACDGGSEHTEALAAAIDELLLRDLRRRAENSERRGSPYGGSVRVKATLVSGVLLEARGFREVTALAGDMATHTSDYGMALERYAERAAQFGNPALGMKSLARKRTMDILAALGQLVDVGGEGVMEHLDDVQANDEEGVEYDPYAGNPFGSFR